MTVSTPSVDDTLRLKLLPPLLSMVAGSADVISFLGLRGLFVAHITGNLVVLAAYAATRARVGLARVLAVPVFVCALAAARLLVSVLEAGGRPSLRPLLLVQFLLLAGYLALAVLVGGPVRPLTGMLGVCAMAAQNALVQVSLRGAPTTAVMTTNITRLTMDVGELLLGRDAAAVAAARYRATHTWPAVVGFAAGAAVGAALYATMGMSSLALPTVLALIAVAGPLPSQSAAVQSVRSRAPDTSALALATVSGISDQATSNGRDQRADGGSARRGLATVVPRTKAP